MRISPKNMKWARIGLEVLGAIFLLGVMGFGAWMLWGNSSNKFNKASRKDVQFILNWGGLSPNQEYKIISSFESGRTFTGDHLDYYCIELSKFDIAGWAKDEWHDGPETNPLLSDALQLAVDDAREHGASIPPIEKSNSSAMKIMFPQVVARNRQATAADIILYDPDKKMLYYVSFKT
jgi:hypothetical protein